MAKKNAFNTVTTLSKTLAFIMFVTFPFIGLYMGMQYQKALDKPFMQDFPDIKRHEKPKSVSGACTMEAKLCPDGSYVGREGPKCEFKTCPGEGER